MKSKRAMLAAIGLLSLSVFVLAAAAAGGTTRYMSPSGVDNPTCTKNSPCKHVQQAVNVASVGDTMPTAVGRPLTSEAGPAPSAAGFAEDFTGVSNAYAIAHGDPARITHADCVRASRDHYMCSYALARPGRPKECHLMQAVWTPNSLSSFTVTLSGRVKRCGSLRDALRSLP